MSDEKPMGQVIQIDEARIRDQRRAGVEGIEAQARREVVGLHVGAKAAHRPHRRQRIERGVGRIQRHPVVPGALEEAQVARRVDACEQRVEAFMRLRRFEPAEAAPLQFRQHVVEPRRHFVAGHQAAAEHLLAAGVAGMVRVVDDEHGEGRAAGVGCAILRGAVTPLDKDVKKLR